MSRSDRMFEIIQILRGADGPVTADALARALEVTPRTVYRDVAALQGMRVPIAGEAGVGYIMRPGYDLPPLMFDAEEAEAVLVGLAMIGRTGDGGLRAAADRAGRKIAAVLPDGGGGAGGPALYASDWTAIPQTGIDTAFYRAAIRECDRLGLLYHDGDGTETRRTVKPIGLIYYIEAVVLAAWCELRADFRHFRLDRIAKADRLGDHFGTEAAALRRAWEAQRREDC